ncbi:HlyD family efflux transporter periplasmic adaptor subunit [candidate division KSB1 bacterium]|nr:HlyD family efflux transporter periplasmic adaptor subunit [candidate division KSB1 bacterium]
MDRKIEKKKWTLKKIISLSLIGILLLAIIYSFIFGDSSSRLNVDSERITISTVKRGEFQEYIPVTGSVIPIKTFYLDAVEGGRVETIYLEAGSYVEKGDKILKLANTNLLLDIMYREAQLFEQSNNLRNTRLMMEQNSLTLRRELVELNYQIKTRQKNYQRAKELVQKKLIAEQEYEHAKDEYEYLLKRKELTIETQRQDSIFRQIQIEQLEASLKRMESNLEIVKQKLENLILKAPISGQLTSLNAEIGESKSPGERLGQIDVLEGFKVRAEIDEHYIVRIELGRKGAFEFADKTYQLEVKKIYPEVRNGRFEVDLEFSNATPDGIRQGQTLHIKLELGDLSEAVLLARGGFYQKTGGQWVYVLDHDEDYAVKRRVRLGRQNPQVFEVLEGLEPGEKVVTSSYDNFGDKDKLVLQ